MEGMFTNNILIAFERCFHYDVKQITLIDHLSLNCRHGESDGRDDDDFDLTNLLTLVFYSHCLAKKQINWNKPMMMTKLVSSFCQNAVMHILTSTNYGTSLVLKN